MKSPKFWQKKNFLSIVLYPLGLIYAKITTLRTKIVKPFKADIPVICVGNLTAGGNGKTPVAISLANIFKKAGKKPFFVTRGYGGKLQDIIVDETKHKAQDVGDEPLLLNKHANVIVNRQRDEAAKKAIKNGADVIIMDDGLQNPLLYKNKSLIVIDGAVGFGNEFPIPAGPLRELCKDGMNRAHAIIMLGEDKKNILNRFPYIPAFKGDVIPLKPEPQKDKAIAFAGIGRPQKFYQSLKECGINVIKTFDFPDHHFYTNSELQIIIKEANKLQAEIFTTSKDMVKIPAELQFHFKVLEIEIQWEDKKALQQFLLN